MRAFRKSLFAIVAFLALALPVAAEDELGPENDYGRSRIGGMTGAIEWESLLHGTGLEGWTESGSPWTPDGWSRAGKTVIGNITGQKKSRITQGDSNWTNYEFSVHATLRVGSNLELHFRVSDDGQTFYMLDYLAGWKALAISKRDRHTGQIVKLSVVNFVMERGREYHIVIAARGQSLTSYIDGKLINQLTDDTYSRGGVGLNMWWTTNAIFRDPKIRHYN